MLSKGTAMLDMGEIISIDELARKMQFADDSIDKDQLKDATCHIKQVVGPGLSEKAAQVFLGTVSLCPAMPNAAQVYDIHRFLCGLSGCSEAGDDNADEEEELG